MQQQLVKDIAEAMALLAAINGSDDEARMRRLALIKELDAMYQRLQEIESLRS